MTSIQFKKVIFLGLIVILMNGCDVASRVIRSPKDDLQSACSESKKIAQTTISCPDLIVGNKNVARIPVGPAAQNWKNIKCTKIGDCFLEIISDAPPIPPENPNGTALVVFIESGSWEGNKTNPGLGALYENSKFPERLQKHIRTFMNNFMFAILENTFKTYGDKYSHVYIIKGDVGLKEIFLQTIQKATRSYGKVDILHWGHGQKGRWLASPDLLSGEPYNISAANLVSFAQEQMSMEERNRVKAVISTACYQANASEGMSMSGAIAVAFPKAFHYGGQEVNFYPIHRDAVMFQEYYRSGDFETAMGIAKNNLVNDYKGTRQSFTFPSLQAGLCADIFGVRKCALLPALPTTTMAATNGKFNDSNPIIYRPGDKPK